jgi:ectoine hydroxylase-related dioxygenase (phytanoyl-CoA dioxygenase family)
MTEYNLHPWNEKFEWKDASPRTGFLSQEQVDRYNIEGYLLLEEALGIDQLLTVTEHLDKLAFETNTFLKTLENERLSIAEAGAILFGIHPCLKSEVVKNFVSEQPFTDICHDLIGPNVRLYWDQLVYKETEKPRRFPWHQDNGYGFVKPQQYLTCWIPLVDVHQGNGCPWIVPKVHRLGTLSHEYIEPLGYECFEEHPVAIPVEAEAGSVIIFSSLTPHKTGPNLSGETRKAYIIQYAPAGAELLQGEPEVGPPRSQQQASDPKRQFPILVDGLLVH